MTQPITNTVDESDPIHADNERMIKVAKEKAARRVCNFCERDENNVMLLIAGRTAFICGECSQLVADITLKGLWERATRLQNTIKDIEKHGGTPAIQGVSDMEIPQS